MPWLQPARVLDELARQVLTSSLDSEFVTITDGHICHRLSRRPFRVADSAEDARVGPSLRVQATRDGGDLVRWCDPSQPHGVELVVLFDLLQRLAARLRQEDEDHDDVGQGDRGEEPLNPYGTCDLPILCNRGIGVQIWRFRLRNRGQSEGEITREIRRTPRSEIITN